MPECKEELTPTQVQILTIPAVAMLLRYHYHKHFWERIADYPCQGDPLCSKS